jgi:hypothetical protein
LQEGMVNHWMRHDPSCSLAVETRCSILYCELHLSFVVDFFLKIYAPEIFGEYVEAIRFPKVINRERGTIKNEHVQILQPVFFKRLDFWVSFRRLGFGYVLLNAFPEETPLGF